MQVSASVSVIYCMQSWELYSATAPPLRETVLASTINAMVFASGMCSLNCSRIRGCPGTSTTRSGFSNSPSVNRDEFVCMDVCVGSTWSKIS
jgi:hypothetical protein